MQPVLPSLFAKEQPQSFMALTPPENMKMRLHFVRALRQACERQPRIPPLRYALVGMTPQWGSTPIFRADPSTAFGSKKARQTSLRMTGLGGNSPREQQIPCGNDRKKSESKDKSKRKDKKRRFPIQQKAPLVVWLESTAVLRGL
jgi:hypothetical protein